MEPITSTFEDWTIRVKPPEQRPAKVLLLLHGWTGDETSMWFFASNLSNSFWLIAPRAPYPAPQGGFSWRPLSSDSTHPATYEQMRPSAAMLLDLIDRWGIANSVDVGQVDIMGFSQGAALSLTFALTYPKRVRKIGILAGFPPREIDSLVETRQLDGKPVFVTHGTSDKLVPIHMAQQTLGILEKAGAKVTYCEADVGHKVSSECLRALEDFFSH